jgi:hypothetical protein
MGVSLKALIVILAIAAVVFRLAKPIAVRFSDARDFARRRNVWFVLTVTAFLSPNFWLFTLVAAPLLAWAGRKDRNPVALYLLMLHVIPAIAVDIPLPGVKAFFDLDIYRILSFSILIPVAFRLRKSKDTTRIRGVTAMEVWLLAYGALQIVLFVRPVMPDHTVLEASFTNDLRVAFLYFIDVYVLYFVVSRSCSSRQLIMEGMAAFCLSCAVMAAVAIFETLRHWLLYGTLMAQWDIGIGGYYVFREGALRAQASSGNTLVLGYLLALACGFWQYLQSHIDSRFSRIAVPLLLWSGMLATYARGPAVGVVVTYAVFNALRPRALPRLFKHAVGAFLIFILVSLSPLGARVGALLPFISRSTDNQAASSVRYRQHLAQESWELIMNHPFFGDQFALLKLEDLRQGEGIIDIVNVYANVAVFYGFIGLAVFFALVLLALSKAYRTARKIVQEDPDLALMGFCLVSCIIGTLVMMATCSFIFGYAKLYYVLAAFAAAYAHLGRSLKRGTMANGPISRSREIR